MYEMQCSACRSQYSVHVQKLNKTDHLTSTRTMTLPSSGMFILIINNDNHPHTNLTIIRQQRRTMNPAMTALVVKPGHPLNTGCDAPPGHHGVDDMIAFRTCFANAV
jgi:hypothetical protein